MKKSAVLYMALFSKCNIAVFLDELILAGDGHSVGQKQVTFVNDFKNVFI